MNGFLAVLSGSISTNWYKRSFFSSSSFQSDKVEGQDGDGDQSVEVVAAVKEVALRVFLDRSQSSNLSERKLIFRKEEDERTCDLLQIFLSQCCPSRLLTIGADARDFYYKICHELMHRRLLHFWPKIVNTMNIQISKARPRVRRSLAAPQQLR